MKLSIAICTHNEGYYLESIYKLLDYIEKEQDPSQYEVIIVDDCSTDVTTGNILDKLQQRRAKIWLHNLNNDFASHKNFMNSVCNGDWILNLDADEEIPLNILQAIPFIIEENPEVEAYWLSRVNTVAGLTLKHIQQWRWVVTPHPTITVECMDKSSESYELIKAHNLIKEERDEWVYYNKPVIQFPDPQMRLYKNIPHIKWKNKVHEILDGYTHFSQLPFTPEYSIIHNKDIARQVEQNDYYATLIK